MPDILCALHAVKPIAPQAVRHLYDAAGWWPQRSLDDIAFVLAQNVAVGAWLDQQLVGFARAVSDGKFRAYIEDVMVHPAYQRRDVSRQLLDHLLIALAHIETVSLFCQPALIALYEQHGFKLYATQKVLHRPKRSL